MKQNILLLALCMLSATLHAQDESAMSVDSLDAVTVIFNKWEQKKSEIPHQVVSISRNRILSYQPQTTADLLARNGAVFVQKSQMGGGSPMIRGFATNRVLLVLDGVRMNNAIYRSGNLQNILSIDALSLQSAEVVLGPGSLIYGSDAIGGVMDFHALQPEWSSDSSLLVRGMALARYASANDENTWHADLRLGTRRWAWSGSITHSRFRDQKMGKRGGYDNYLRPEYVERINGVDSIVTNSDPRLQRFNGYSQLNETQKIAYRISAHSSIQYGFTYAETGTAPRYDRLIQYRNGKLRFAEWNYGPMLWRMHSVQLNLGRANSWFTESRLVAAFQSYEESRIDRSRENPIRTTQTEQVNAISMNWDARRRAGAGTLYYGLEWVQNKVGSIGQTTNIETSENQAAASRYPDGSRWLTAGIYASYNYSLSQLATLTGGLRYSYNMVRATFRDEFVAFPYEEANLNDGALTGTAGIVYHPDAAWQLTAHLGTGYRMPNIDDLGKLFESAPGNVVVPNPGLKSEYAVNGEFGVVYRNAGRYRLSTHIFYTRLHQALARRPFQFNGRDSIEFNGVMSQVEALQNIARAAVYGIQARFDMKIAARLDVYSQANWIEGKETDDEADQQVPLRHAPPFYGETGLQYRPGKALIELLCTYNGGIGPDGLAPSEQDKPYLYVPDSQGRLYSPGWSIFTIRCSIPINKIIVANLAWENMGNRQYRPYSSGVVAPGSQIMASIRVSLALKPGLRRNDPDGLMVIP